MSMRISFCTKSLVNGAVYTTGIAQGRLHSQDVILRNRIFQRVELLKGLEFKAFARSLPGQKTRGCKCPQGYNTVSLGRKVH